MFEKIGRIAELAATGASRREFLGRAARGAMTLAAAVGGLLAFPNNAGAEPRGNRHCCAYECARADGSIYGLTRTSPCPKGFVNGGGDSCRLIGRSDCGGR